MPDLLVTGGAGFIGANFVRHWRTQRPSDRLVVLDALTYAGNLASLDGIEGIEFVRGDISDTALVAALLADRRLDTIVHFAAETHVDRSIEGPDVFIETNVGGTHSLLKAARAVWLDKGSGRPHRFHHVSTDEVFGSLGPDDPPFTELSRYAPNSPYSASKAGSDHLVRAYRRTFGLETTISNCSNNYGPYQYPEKLVPLMLINCLTGVELPVFGDGMNMRDWLHVEDHCRGVEAVLLRGRAGEAYNVGGGEQLPNLAVVESICGAVDAAFAEDPELRSRFPKAPAARGQPSSSLLRFVADRPGHDRRYAIDDSKIRQELGYRARWSFEEGLPQTIRWYLNRERWWHSTDRRVAPGGD